MENAVCAWLEEMGSSASHRTECRRRQTEAECPHQIHFAFLKDLGYNDVSLVNVLRDGENTWHRTRVST